MTMTLTMFKPRRTRTRPRDALLACFFRMIFVCLFKARIIFVKKNLDVEKWCWWMEGVSNKDVVRFLIFVDG